MVRWDAAQKSVEQARSRPDGFVRGLVNPLCWLDVVKVVFYGTTGVLWERVWGGKCPGPTVMVLASLMYCNTGQLGNPAQIVEI